MSSDEHIKYEEFKIVPTNYSSIYSSQLCYYEKYKPWIKFLSNHDHVGYAIKAGVNIH